MTMNDIPPHQVCSALRSDGKPCRALPVYGGTTCYMHSGFAFGSQRSGGKTHAIKTRPPMEAPDLSSPEKQRVFLQGIIAQAVNSEIGTNLAKLLVYAVSVIKTIGDDEILKRLEALEAANGKA